MNGFIYFFPGKTAESVLDRATSTINAELLEAHGLIEVFGDSVHSPTHCVIAHTKQGPDGSPGVTVYLKPIGEEIGESPSYGIYAGEEQEWQLFEIDGKPLWVGYCKESPPNEESLRRSDAYFSYRFNDSIGGNWMLPIVRSPDLDRGNLPMDYSFDNTGKLIRQLKAKHKAIWDLAGEAENYLCGKEPPEGQSKKGEEWVVQVALRFLQLNYRIWKPELSLLAQLGCTVLDNSVSVQALMFGTDFFLRQEHAEFQKKSETQDPDT